MQTAVSHVPVKETALRMTGSAFFARALRRLRETRVSTLVFYLFALVTVVGWFLPYGLVFMSMFGVGTWLLQFLLPMLLIVSVMLGAQQICVDQDAELARRPWRFAAVVATAMVVPYLVLWCVNMLAESEVLAYVLKRAYLDFPRYAFFFAPIGWLSCLYSQRADDMATLTQLSVQRSSLSRDLAQSRLLAARARIDPLMVIEVLRKIRRRYPDDPATGSDLMDHLIAYLRLAMNRAGDRKPSLASETEMARAYLSLRREETGSAIGLVIEGGGVPVERVHAPVFLLTRKISDVAASARMRDLALYIGLQEQALIIRLWTGRASLPHESLDSLRETLTEIFSRDEDILHHISETGEHWYVFEIPVESRNADGADR